MNNKLIKVATKSYTYGSPGVPGSPATPPTPGHYAWQDSIVCSFHPVQLPSVGGLFIDGVVDFIGSVPVVYECTPGRVQVYVPASPGSPGTPGVPASPASTATNYNLGWNSGARSIATLPADGYVSFKADHPIGAVVGFATEDSDGGYTRITHGFYLSHGAARIYESGVDKVSAGAYTRGSTFRIERLNKVVTYKINGTVVYTSTVLNGGEVFIDTSFYSGEDYIYDPTISVSAGTSGSAINMLPALRASAANESFCSSAAALPRLVTSASIGAHGNVASVLPHLQALASNKPYGMVASSFPSVRASGEGGSPVPPYAICETVLGGLSVGAVGYTGGIGQVAVSLKPLRTLASEHAYCAALVTLPKVRALALALDEPGSATIGEVGYASDTIVLEPTVMAVMDVSGALAGVFGVTVVANAPMSVAAGVQSSLSTVALANALMQSYVQAKSDVPVWDQLGEVWVVNYDTAASSSYENFAFNSLAQVGQQYFGAQSDGVYLLEGGLDAGAPIHASISLGKSKLGSEMQKRVPECYLGASSNGTLFLKVIADGNSHVYEARNAASQLGAQRVTLGKGLQANYFTFEIYNHDGCDFELNTVEFRVVDLQRRIK